MNIPLSEIEFRDVELDDINYIKNSWLLSCKESPEFSYVTNGIFFKNHADIVESLIQFSNIIILCSTQDTQVIFGYVVYDFVNGDLIIDWAAVKKSFRNMGIFSMMLERIYKDLELSLQHDQYYFTHLPSDTSKFILRSQFQKHKALFNPYLRSRYL